MQKNSGEKRNRSRTGAFTNLHNANAFVDVYNSAILQSINRFFTEAKGRFLSENDFFSAINLKVRLDTNSVFSAPVLRKKVILQPPSVDNKKEFVAEPAMSNEMYLDILKVIYDAGKSMEKKPSLYQQKDEEGLRDQFLFILETRYEGTTASGETFNRGGKTDIILKYSSDGSNLFVAECKFWHGASEFQKAISQLFDRYLTWRDSKTSLIIFVDNKDFSNVLETIKLETPKHHYYTSFSGLRGESSFSYLFHLPQDNSKTVFLEIIVFHFDK